MRKISLLSLILSALMVAACSTAPGANNSVEQVTSIPDVALTPTTNAQPTTVADASTSDDVQTIADVPTDNSAANDDETTADTGSDIESESSAQATPTPLSNQLEAGESRAIALATDTGMQPTPRGELIRFNQQPVILTFDEFYDGFNIRTGLQLSDKLISLDGKEVTIEGYMAPPLKPALDWFVLTRIQLAICPFCSTDADWPNDIALAYMPDGTDITATQYPIRVTGTLHIGSSVDAETGMVSVVRIYVDEYEVLR